MKKIVVVVIALLFAGCLGTPNVHFFPKSAKSYEVQCSKNFDLCLERAEYKCGFKGYKIIEKQKEAKGYTLHIRCNR